MAGVSYQNAWCGWKTMCFSAQKARKRSLFSENLAGIPSLAQ